nr:DNA-polymerase-like [Ipomoea trifida]GMD18005.1 orf148 [Ipomoea batatas]GMD19393.1 orf148 [Ipomoea batatas]
MIASHNFFEPYPLVNEIVLLSLATMDLLNKFAYPSLSGYGKFTITFTMMRSYGEEISFTLGQAISLTYMDKVYDGDYIVRLMIHKNQAPCENFELINTKDFK